MYYFIFQNYLAFICNQYIYLLVGTNNIQIYQSNYFFLHIVELPLLRHNQMLHSVLVFHLVS